MDDITQSTDVGGTPNAGAGESTSAAPSSVEHSESTEQATASSHVTTQPETQGEAGIQSEAVDSAPDTDPLEGVPGLDELEQNQHQPYAKALRQLRTAYEARKEEFTGLKSQLEPIQPLLEQNGGLETVQSRLEAYNSLFTPVVNPETQQPELDDRGFQRISAAPFIERVDGENPGMAEIMLNDLLRYTPDRGDGQRVPLVHSLFEAYGLDPNRLADYRNIDALTAQPSAGEITPDELQAVPEEFRDVYKTLPAGVRTDLQMQDEATRQFNLEVYKERADRKAEEAQRAQAAQAERQQAEVQVREYVTKEQDTYVEQQLQESYALLMDDLKSQVTFSGDENQNAVVLDTIGAYLLALRDPAQSFAVTNSLARLGVKVDASFHQAVADADKHLRDAKAFELFGHKDRARNARTEAENAKKLALAKSSTIALKVAKALGGQIAEKATREGQLLKDASTLRPTPNGGASTATAGGLLPEGMRANDPRVATYLAKQLGLTR